MILYAGRAVESGGGTILQGGPHHPYTELLLASVPELRTNWLDGINHTTLEEAAGGLSFADATMPCPIFRRCAVRIPSTCDIIAPPVAQLADGRRVACHNEGRRSDRL